MVGDTRMDFDEIAANGGGLDIDLARTRLAASELNDIARHGQRHGSALIIRNATLTKAEMKQIARSSPGNVVFVL